MIIHFFEPPPSQTTGGLILAIQSLRSFLERSGLDVRNSTTVKELGESRAGEVVHFHGLWQFNFLSISAHCRRQNVPYLVSPHGMLEPWAFKHKWWKKWPYFHLLEKRHLAGAQRLLATSEGEATNLQKFFPRSRCEVLPLGLATASKWPDYSGARSALGWKDSELILLFLSRIHPKKGLHLLLAALAKVPPALSQQVRLVIVGGGELSYLRKLQRFQKNNRSRLPRINWVGEVWSDEKWRYLQGADLFCLPSYSENFGLAILEALQVGTRVLTTNQTPWKAVLAWDAGYLVDPAEEAIASALMEQLTKAPRWALEQRDSLAEKIHHQFSWDSVGPRYLRLYADIARSGDP
jgi:glycosyltransferase involved in cell wall biosynthesis